MLLGFKKQFVDYVAEHSKRHTIRAYRGSKQSPRPGMAPRQVKVGDRADLYANPRQKSMRLLGRHPVTRVQCIDIRRHAAKPGDTDFLRLDIRIDGIELSRDEVMELAWKDGFREHGKGGAMWAMALFWEREHNLYPGGPPFVGQLIHWDPAVDVAAPAKAVRKTKRAAA